MNLQGRIELLFKHEHAELRAAIPRVGDKVLSIPLPPRRASASPVPPPRGGGRSQLQAPPEARPFNPRALQEAWRPFAEALVAHMQREREIVLPLVLEVVKGGNMRRRDELRIWIEQMQAEHAQLRKLAGSVRVETLSTEAGMIRRDVHDVLALFENHTRAEELEIYPAAEGGETPVVTRKRTSDEILRTLRRDRPAEPEPEEEEEEEAGGLFGRLKGLFARGR